MNATDPASLPPVTSGEEPAAPTTSVFAKMCNVFTEPGEVFEEVRASKHNFLNWLVPCLAGIVVAVGNMAMNPGPVLLVREQLDSANKTHRVLSALNLPMLWYLAVMAAGLSRLSGKPWIVGAAWTFLPYAIIMGGMILLGIGGGGF